jgi:predicted protein tyrosine phosphatase
MRLLFICSRNRLRSPTAEATFSQVPGIETMSAGMNHDAPTPVSGDLIEWADLICVMEPAHQARLAKRFSPLLGDKRVVVLGIPDEYGYMDPDPISLLKNRVLPLLR